MLRASGAGGGSIGGISSISSRIAILSVFEAVAETEPLRLYTHICRRSEMCHLFGGAKILEIEIKKRERNGLFILLIRSLLLGMVCRYITGTSRVLVT
jgi:hypothetical protein